MSPRTIPAEEPEVEHPAGDVADVGHAPGVDAGVELGEMGVGFGGVVKVVEDPAGVGPCVVVFGMAFGGREDNAHFVLEGGN